MGSELFNEWNKRLAEVLERAKATSLREPHAVTLATSTQDGRPSARVVLLRGFDDRGLVFYTNGCSRKGQELYSNPYAALCFHWDELREQVRVEGPVERVADEESDAYWHKRPRESRIGAIASRQSHTLDDRTALEERVQELEAQYSDEVIPRPDDWHGFRVISQRVEFWVDRSARLHDRDVYERDDAGDWGKFKLYP